MNIQELIEKYRKFEKGLYDIEAKVACQHFLKDLEQLDEPQKVVVPQFVADWIKVAKPIYSLSGAMVYGSPGVNKWLESWGNQGLFARAWLDGYEVEKEKRYLVKVKGLSEHYSYLNYDSIDNEWYFADSENGPAVGTNRTRKELEEAGFGWVFDCPGIEIEEVE